MFKGIQRKINDMRTLKYLCERAEAYALQDQQREPGAEHFLLAALDLPDGTARLAVERLGVTPSDLRHAINQQYDDALRSIGLAPPMSHNAPMRASSGVYQAAPSAQEIMQELAAIRKRHGPLLGAHVIEVVAGMSHGVAARAFQALNIDPGILQSTAADAAASAP